VDKDMQKRIHETIEITDLKDMLRKTGEVYADRPAYKFKTDIEDQFDVITHKEFREMVDGLRNSTYKIRFKRKKNSCYRRKQI